MVTCFKTHFKSCYTLFALVEVKARWVVGFCEKTLSGFSTFLGEAAASQAGWSSLSGGCHWWVAPLCVSRRRERRRGKEDDMMIAICLLCCIAHLLSFGFVVVSWTGVVESGSGRPGELLLLLFTLWLQLVICRRSRARKEATLDSISDWECLGQEFISHN